MIDYAALIRGGLELLLILMLYYAAKDNGKKEATIDQFVKARKERDEYEQFHESRMSRMESEIQTFKKSQYQTDYGNATDSELLALHEGRAIEGIHESGEEHTKPDFNTTDKPPTKL